MMTYLVSGVYWHQNVAITESIGGLSSGGDKALIYCTETSHQGPLPGHNVVQGALIFCRGALRMMATVKDICVERIARLSWCIRD